MLILRRKERNITCTKLITESLIGRDLIATVQFVHKYVMGVVCIGVCFKLRRVRNLLVRLKVCDVGRHCYIEI